jgi:hypothetical protein
MKTTLKVLIVLASSVLYAVDAHLSFSQERMPVLQATSEMVDIKDGRAFKKSAWRISPQLNPDVYTTHTKNERVTFYTDIDSMSFLIDPQRTYGFIILLNGRDSAFTEIRYTPSFLDVLKAAGNYDWQDRSVHADFTYKSQDSPDLKSIRTHFKLDSIAGAGDEIGKVLNILHWVHTTFPHDGTKDAPRANGAEELMTKCINEQKTLDCGSLATVLNECYSAVGFTSRRIVCLPKDSTDFDCHSINAVYSKTLGKWLWMDATNDAYVMNEQNELLSIPEVRDYLINDRPLKLNADANWNHIRRVEKEDYLYDYMAKNLFAVECFNVSGGVNKSILLLPSDYEGIIPRTRSLNPMRTSNPDIFWAIPR